MIKFFLVCGYALMYIKIMNTKKRLIRTLVLCLIGLGIGAAIAFYQISNESAVIIKQGQSKASPSEAMAGVGIGGPFELSDHTGVTVTQADYDGQYKLIYFGFTYCPAICPTELQKMAQVYEALDEDEQSKLQQLFITVDPERDTIDVMREYVTLFSPDLIGLRGNEQQTADVKDRYKIYATKVQDENMSDYTIDHSSYIYLMSSDNKLLSVYRIEDNADYILSDMRKFISQS